MTGTRSYISFVIISGLLFGSVTIAANLDNSKEQDMMVAASVLRPIVPDRDPELAPTTTTTSTTVAALPPSVPVTTTTAPPRVYTAAAVTTPPTTVVKATEEAPTPPPETESAPVSSGDDCMGWRSYVEMRGLPTDTFCGDADNPGIIYCESKGNPNAQNGQHAGLTQLAKQYHEGRANKLGYAWSDMHDGSANLHVASDLYNESGLSPWYPSKYCWG